MRILHLLSQTHLTGAESYAITLGTASAKRGHEVHLISDQIHLPHQLIYTSRPIHQARGFFARLREILWLRRYLQENQIEIVHTHSRAAVRIAWWACLFHKTAMVSTIHGQQHYSLGKRLFHFYGQKMIAVCENLKEQLMHDFHYRATQIRVIGNPIHAHFEPHEPHANENLKKYLYVTRWSGPKGEDSLLFLKQVAPVLLNTKQNILINVCGSPPPRNSEAEKILSNLATEFKDRFCFLGFKNNLHEYILQHDIIIGAGRVAIEGLMHQRQTYVFGESFHHGFVNEKNIQACLATNFGDIHKTSQRFDPKKSLEDLLHPHSLSEDERVRLQNLMIQKFSIETVTDRVHEVYLSARYLKNHSQPIPVLMYHQVVDEPLKTEHRVFVTKKTFEKHISMLKKLGFTGIHFKDLYLAKYYPELYQLPKKPILITFDDGYQNTLTKALPVLEKYEFKAVVYLLANPQVRSNSWDQQSDQLMTQEERKILSQSRLIEIGSHGFNHQKISQMTMTDAFVELHGSKESIEKELQKEVVSFAFTFGVFTSETADLAERAGYKYAVNTDQGGFHIEESPFEVFRVNIFPEDGVFALFKKTHWSYRPLFKIKRGK